MASRLRRNHFIILFLWRQSTLRLLPLQIKQHHDFIFISSVMLRSLRISQHNRSLRLFSIAGGDRINLRGEDASQSIPTTSLPASRFHDGFFEIVYSGNRAHHGCQRFLVYISFHRVFTFSQHFICRTGLHRA